ncbi:MAG: hypothetical protein ABUS79_01470 [Pseudomonadota bacterium]
MEGKGTLALAAGKLPGSPLFVAMEAVLGRAALQGSAYQPATIPFRIADDRMHFDPFELRTSLLSMGVSGWADLAGPVDLRIAVRAPSDAMALARVPPEVLSLIDDGGWVTVPVRVVGPPEAQVDRRRGFLALRGRLQPPPHLALVVRIVRHVDARRSLPLAQSAGAADLVDHVAVAQERRQRQHARHLTRPQARIEQRPEPAHGRPDQPRLRVAARAPRFQHVARQPVGERPARVVPDGRLRRDQVHRQSAPPQFVDKTVLLKSLGVVPHPGQEHDEAARRRPRRRVVDRAHRHRRREEAPTACERDGATGGDQQRNAHRTHSIVLKARARKPTACAAAAR